jgi:hypothetical protein
VLGREPDAQGLDYWLDAMDYGFTRKQVAEGFLGSPEFASASGMSNPDFVEFLYQQCLGRPSDSGGKAYWINQITSGTSRADVLIGFSESPEHRTQTADILGEGLWKTDNNYQQVVALYDGFGDRLPDLNGLQYWVGQLKAGASLNSVAAGFAASPEFTSNTAGFSNADLVEYMYNNTLDRASDPGGKQYWLSQLDHGLSKGDLLLGFSMSPEHIQALETHLYSGVDFYVG